MHELTAAHGTPHPLDGHRAPAPAPPEPGRRRRRRAVRAIIPAGAVAGCLALVASQTVSAASAVTVGSTATLSDRVLIDVPVTVVCDPLPNTVLLSEVSASVEQAGGQTVSRGTGSVSTPLTCDGTTPNTVVVPVSAGSTPFHGGGAVVTGSFEYETGISCGFPGCYYDQQLETGSSAPTPVQVHG